MDRLLDAPYQLGLASYRPDDQEQIGRWAVLARTCGWWRPGEELCVGTERPELIWTEPVPGAWRTEIRLTSDGIRYRDGWHPHLT